ncbi:thioredoxin family protein [Nonlabens tegetincola]|uniref:thioredoxin family protein n=1 Tax=Nonlabens tegetincola TaxID=323273 RepID=UPI000CF4EE29|nr:thioredoxin fold domain-containing protein [Nonlabens tegetincola]PQJ20539.1 thioredoxin family protein [Nonlabens tegetincola]
MKKLLFILFIVPVFATAQVNWMTMDEALAAQKKEPRKILLKSYTEWCPNCKWMDKYAFSKSELAEFINDNYYPVAFNAEGTESITYQGTTYSNPDKRRNDRSPHQFAEKLRIFEYPTLVFFDENGQFISTVPGKLDSKKLEIYVTMLVDDSYKSINTGKKWSDYQKDFEYKLQG